MYALIRLIALLGFDWRTTLLGILLIGSRPRYNYSSDF